MNELKVVYLSPDELTPYENNTRKHAPVDIEQIKESILQDGFNDPIGIWGEQNIIVEGHGRHIASKELHLDKVPCIRLDHLTDDQRRDYAIRHNRTAELSTWDFGTLSEELAQLEIEGHDFSGLNFDLEFEELTHHDSSQDVEETETPELPQEAKAKLGDIYQLGKHRLMCGDSTSAEDVETLMDGLKANMVFTDPPYGVDYEGGVIHGNKINVDHKRSKLKNDNTDIYSKFISLLNLFIDDGAIYIFYATRNSYELLKPLKENGIEVHSIIVWNKINTGYADINSHYKNKYEPCVYACRKGYSLNWHGGTSECTVWDINKDRDNKLHPTQKPIEVCAKAIINSSAKGDIVLDLFGGSGSTLIACEQTDRKCFMMELDPRYVDVIIERWENLTGQKAVKLNG